MATVKSVPERSASFDGTSVGGGGVGVDPAVEFEVWQAARPPRKAAAARIHRLLEETRTLDLL